MHIHLLIREAAVSHYKCFHACSNVTAANIVAYLISKPKSYSDKLDRKEETERKVPLQSQMSFSSCSYRWMFELHFVK